MSTSVWEVESIESSMPLKWRSRGNMACPSVTRSWQAFVAKADLWIGGDWGALEFKYGKCACCGWGNVDCLLMAMPVANGLLENPPGTSERLICLTSVTGSSLIKVHLLYCLFLPVVVRERKNVGSDTRQNELLVQLGNCHPLSCGEGLIIKEWPVSLGIAILWAASGRWSWDELQPHWPLRGSGCAFTESSYLVDPASSHMLVSKIKPCMSKYKQVCTVKLRMAH